jgi:FG-GAP repeat/FG-GAP-like repeat
MGCRQWGAMGLIGTLAAWSPAQSPGTVTESLRMSMAPGFTDSLDPGDEFGAAIADIGDLDGNGIHDLLVGAPGEKVGPSSDAGRGCAFVILRSAEGVKAFHRIGAEDQLLPGVDTGDKLGRGVAFLGDLDGDGRVEVALGQPEGEISLPTSPGRVWIVSLESDGTVGSHVEISEGLGGFSGALAPRGQFGWSVAALGDLDGDGVTELAVGSPKYDEIPAGTADLGAVWVLFLEASGHVKAQHRISGKIGGVGTQMQVDDYLGHAVAGPGDLDHDGVPDLVAAAPYREMGGVEDGGVVFTLLLNPDGTVKQCVGLGAALGDPPVALTDGAGLGFALASVGDIDGNGVPDVAASSPGDQDGASGSLEIGALWFLMLRANGTLKDASKISALSGGLGAPVEPGDRFATGLAVVGGPGAPGSFVLAGGATEDDHDLPPGTINDPGAVWLLQLDATPSVQAWTKLNDETPGFENTLHPRGRFGHAAAAIGDIDGDGVHDLAVGAPDDGAGTSVGSGAVFILLRAPDGGVKSWHKLDAYSEPAIGLGLGDDFGAGLAAPGDVNGDGHADLAVSASGTEPEGAVHVLFLDGAGQVQSSTRIAPGESGFVPPPGLHSFGRTVGAMPDLDGDGVPELLAAMNLPQLPGQTYEATILILFLAPDGSVRSTSSISYGTPGFPYHLRIEPEWPLSFAPLGDLDGDGHPELAVGAGAHGSGPEQQYGIVWILTLGPDGGVLGVHEIANGIGGLPAGLLGFLDRFGTSVTGLPDIDGDGVRDLAVGAGGEDGPFLAENSGGLWILRLKPNMSVKGWQLVADTTGGFSGPPLDAFSELGHALALLQDGDQIKLTAGAPRFKAGGDYERGELWTLTLATGGDPWATLGLGLAGSFGMPNLQASGPLLPDTDVELTAFYPTAFAPATLVLGLSQANIPFKGGVLVPAPNILLPGLVLDAAGTLVLQSAFPPGVPSGTQLFLQLWITGGGGPKGFVATNAVSGLLP